MAITEVSPDPTFMGDFAQGFPLGFQLVERMQSRRQNLAFQKKESARRGAVDRAMGQHRADTLSYYKQQAQDMKDYRDEKLEIDRLQLQQTKEYQEAMRQKAQEKARLDQLSNIHGTAMQALNYESKQLSDQGGGIENPSMVDSRLMAESARIMMVNPNLDFSTVYSGLDATPRNIMSADDITETDAARILLTSGQGWISRMVDESAGQVMGAALAGKLDLNDIKYKPDDANKFSPTDQAGIDALMRMISGKQISPTEGVKQITNIASGRGIQNIQAQKFTRGLSSEEFGRLHKAETNLDRKRVLSLKHIMTLEGSIPKNDEVQVIDINKGLGTTLEAVPYSVAKRMVDMGLMHKDKLKAYKRKGKPAATAPQLGPVRDPNVNTTSGGFQF